MKRVLRVLLPAIALVVVVLSVQGALKPQSASADWPPYGQSCVQYQTQTTWQWRYFNYHWQIVPISQQVCVQYSYVQTQVYSPYCTSYFLYNQCGQSYNNYSNYFYYNNFNNNNNFRFQNCGQAYVDQWGNRFTCFGNQYVSYWPY